MAGIKGVGHGVVDAIIEERNQNGPYKNLYDFIKRVDKSRVGKKQIELLIDAGSFDFTTWSRDAMRICVEEMYDQAQKEQKEQALGVMNLFSLIEEPQEAFKDPPAVVEKSTNLQIFQREKELLGFYLTGHPMDGFKKVLGRLSCMPLSEVETLSCGSVFRSAFVVESVQVKVSSKSQKKFAILIISDGMERFELPVWPEMFEEKGFLLRENQLLYGHLQMERREGAVQLSCRYLDDLTTINEERIKTSDDAFDKLRAQAKARSIDPKWKKNGTKPKSEKVEKEEIKKLTIQIDADKIRLSEVLKLKDFFRSHPGSSTIELHFHSGRLRVGSVFIDAQWGVKATPEFQKGLKEITDNFEHKLS